VTDGASIMFMYLYMDCGVSVRVRSTVRSKPRQCSYIYAGYKTHDDSVVTLDTRTNSELTPIVASQFGVRCSGREAREAYTDHEGDPTGSCYLEFRLLTYALY
jgi:hypothetical protein